VTEEEDGMGWVSGDGNVRRGEGAGCGGGAQCGGAAGQWARHVSVAYSPSAWRAEWPSRAGRDELHAWEHGPLAGRWGRGDRWARGTDYPAGVGP